MFDTSCFKRLVDFKGKIRKDGGKTFILQIVKDTLIF